MTGRIGIVAGMLLLALPALAADLPPDAAIQADGSIRTMAPKVVVNSGRLEWTPYTRDVSAWPTLSYEDKRPTPPPKRVKLEGALNGDPARGKELAMGKLMGDCVVCHSLPGEDWPGTVGHLLMHYKEHGNSDQRVYQQIYDPRIFNPGTVMPAFGTYGILSDQDIRDLVAYLQSLK